MPSRHWIPPDAPRRVEQKFRGVPDSDWQMVDILDAVLREGLLAAGLHSSDVVLNALSRHRALCTIGRHQRPRVPELGAPYGRGLRPLRHTEEVEPWSDMKSCPCWATSSWSACARRSTRC